MMRRSSNRRGATTIITTCRGSGGNSRGRRGVIAIRIITITSLLLLLLSTTTAIVKAERQHESLYHTEENVASNNKAHLLEKYGQDGYDDLIAHAYGNGDDDKTNDQEEEEGGDDGGKDKSCPSPTNNKRIEYGVDVSWPIHSMKVSTNYPWLPHNVDETNVATPQEYRDKPLQVLGNRQGIYEEFMEGCKTLYPDRPERCDATERERISMNRNQPQKMTNYTDLGFMKIKAPPDVYNLIRQYWDENKHLEKNEKWPVGYTYVNNWDNESTMVSVEDPTLPGGGHILKNKIWNAARATISEWTGQSLVTSSLYGIRVYKDGAILAPHVDRLPLISSAIINVDQDVDEDWPLEVYGHDGRVYNISMEPGDMVLYESHSVIHGRPFALKGRYYANIFIHFEPGELPPSEAAKANDVDSLKLIVKRGNVHLLHKPDENQWQPLHEAARQGAVDAIDYLLGEDVGVDLFWKVNGGQDALGLARMYHEEDSETVTLLKEWVDWYREMEEEEEEEEEDQTTKERDPEL